MDATQTASITGLLTPVLGAQVAGVVSIACAAIVVIAHGLMPYLPVATATSSGWYRVLYGALRLASGNYRNAAPTSGGAVVAAAQGVPPSSAANQEIHS